MWMIERHDPIILNEILNETEVAHVTGAPAVTTVSLDDTELQYI